MTTNSFYLQQLFEWYDNIKGLSLQSFSGLILVFGCFADVKADMESRLVQWQSKLDELDVFFKKLWKSSKKSLFKEEDALVTSVANIQLELVKRVIVDLTDWKLILSYLWVIVI